MVMSNTIQETSLLDTAFTSKQAPGHFGWTTGGQAKPWLSWTG